ncbi:MAG: hypothetical protein GY750_07830 [Lentisphaerae bacterium]|nr:hypothetical protein [Lentisphaerota bacterium]MCP4101316.1 hypothetical protein [Lentisphaerota bacterium]
MFVKIYFSFLLAFFVCSNLKAENYQSCIKEGYKQQKYKNYSSAAKHFRNALEHAELSSQEISALFAPSDTYRRLKNYK